jgi:hypothetical protein
LLAEPSNPFIPSALDQCRRNFTTTQSTLLAVPFNAVNSALGYSTNQHGLGITRKEHINNNWTTTRSTLLAAPSKPFILSATPSNTGVSTRGYSNNNWKTTRPILLAAPSNAQITSSLGSKSTSSKLPTPKNKLAAPSDAVSSFIPSATPSNEVSSALGYFNNNWKATQPTLLAATFNA